MAARPRVAAILENGLSRARLDNVPGLFFVEVVPGYNPEFLNDKLHWGTGFRFLCGVIRAFDGIAQIHIRAFDSEIFHELILFTSRTTTSTQAEKPFAGARVLFTRKFPTQQKLRQCSRLGTSWPPALLAIQTCCGLLCPATRRTALSAARRFCEIKILGLVSHKYIVAELGLFSSMKRI